MLGLFVYVRTAGAVDAVYARWWNERVVYRYLFVTKKRDGWHIDVLYHPFFLVCSGGGTYGDGNGNEIVSLIVWIRVFAYLIILHPCMWFLIRRSSCWLGGSWHAGRGEELDCKSHWLHLHVLWCGDFDTVDLLYMTLLLFLILRLFSGDVWHFNVPVRLTARVHPPSSIPYKYLLTPGAFSNYSYMWYLYHISTHNPHRLLKIECVIFIPLWLLSRRHFFRLPPSRLEPYSVPCSAVGTLIPRRTCRTSNLLRSRFLPRDMLIVRLCDTYCVFWTISCCVMMSLFGVGMVVKGEGCKLSEETVRRGRHTTL